MKKIWSFINTPVIVAIESALFVALLGFIAYKSLLAAFLGGDTRDHRIEALSKIDVVSFSEAPANPKENQKFIGTLKNHSPFIVTEIQGSVCFYSKEGKLIDVFTNPLQGIGTLEPGGSREFSILLTRGGEASSVGLNVIGFKTEVKLVDAKVEER